MKYQDTLDQISGIWDIFAPFLIMHIILILMILFIFGKFQGIQRHELYNEISNKIKKISKLGTPIVTFLFFSFTLFLFSYYRLVVYVLEDSLIEISNNTSIQIFPNVGSKPFSKIEQELLKFDNKNVQGDINSFYKSSLFKYSNKNPHSYFETVKISKGAMVRSGQFITFTIFTIMMLCVLSFMRKDIRKKNIALRFLLCFFMLSVFLMYSRFDNKRSSELYLSKVKFFVIENIKNQINSH